ncbi:MAG: SDR family oxidoreductase [Tidjanibacter sp.]|nr:SDR family oxidoreductase [Tidjanibacter sp.]
MKTAFITGATEGIGYELSKKFASAGNNLVIVARNAERLAQVAQEFKTAYGVEVDYYPADLSDLTAAQEIYDDLCRRSIEIEYAVNNAGFGTSGLWTEIAWEQELNMVRLNVEALAYFTKVFARDMVARGHGRILNVASTAAFEPVPYMSAYAATKAFVLSLSNGVAVELEGTGVTVTALCPGVTASKFHARAHTEQTLQKAKLLAQSSSADVAAYGYKIMMKGRLYGVHRAGNRFSMFLTRFLSRRTIARIAATTTH